MQKRGDPKSELVTSLLLRAPSLCVLRRTILFSRTPALLICFVRRSVKQYHFRFRVQRYYIYLTCANFSAKKCSFRSSLENAQISTTTKKRAPEDSLSNNGANPITHRKTAGRCLHCTAGHCRDQRTERRTPSPLRCNRERKFRCRISKRLSKPL